MKPGASRGWLKSRTSRGVNGTRSGSVPVEEGDCTGRGPAEGRAYSGQTLQIGRGWTLQTAVGGGDVREGRRKRDKKKGRK